jgi:CRISPR-associated protein Cmr2
MDSTGLSKSIGGEAMTQYMLMFSLGPVQTFIAQARKTRDLWLGSYLLAILMEAVMRGMSDVLVYPTTPTLEKGSNVPDLPNKYVALFDDLEVAKKAADDSKERISKCWEKIFNDVWEQTIRRHPDKESAVIAHHIWLRQTNPEICFDIFWVIVERNSSEAYGAWLRRTEEAFDARKRLRDFKIPHNLDNPSITDEHGEKSTISGEREALHGKDASPEGTRTFWKGLTEARSNGDPVLKSNDISPNGKERLDAIDTIKRFAYRAQLLVKKEVSPGFPSTSSIATASFVERLLIVENVEADLETWLDITNRKELLQDTAYRDAIPYFQQPGKIASGREDTLLRDGDLYFPETFTAYRLREDYSFPYTTTQEKRETELYADKSSRALKALLHTADSQDITLPTPYYAMIQMDGDKMGVLLSGVKDDAEHKAISEALSKFARTSALNIVQEQYPGRLVYAGGDDVFALAPLARDIPGGQGIVTVLNLVNRLQEQYRRTVAEAVSDPKRQENVTASTGIAIAHHYTSLLYVRRTAKSAEEFAKDHYGRNALVVTMIRRSGEQTRVGCHWQYSGLTMQPITLFSYCYELFRHDVLSPKCLYTLLEESPVLAKLEREAQEKEIKRVLSRQYADKQEGKLTTTPINLPTLARHLVELANAMDNDEQRHNDTTRAAELHSEKRRYGLVEVLGWLLVMAFLARKDQE